MDRRTIWAILLMMAIAIVPAIFLKKPIAPAARGGDAGKRDSGSVALPDTLHSASNLGRDNISAPQPNRDTTKAVASPRAAGATDDTVRVTSPLYTYGISLRGGRLVEATLPRYRSMAPTERGHPAQILPPDSKLLDLTLVLDGRSVPLSDWSFKASAESLSVRGPASLTLSGSRDGLNVDLTYTF